MLDIALIGAGPVGATVAALLADHGLSVAVFEARGGPSNDARTLALSHASRGFLEDARAWPAASATPIASIHISQKGGPGRTVIDAADQDLPALGYTVPFGALEAALQSRLKDSPVEVAFGQSCEAITLTRDAATLRFASGREAQAKLLVLADGGANSSRIPGISYETKDYGQLALTAAVRTDRATHGRAYERFTPLGPVALLPVEDRFALVWTATPEEAKRLMALEEGAFLAALQEHFGDRAGRFVSAGPRAAFPLRLRTVNSTVAMRTVIVGNAAQALHPIAGQGLNLGLRDAVELVEAITATPPETLGSDAMLFAYRDARRRDAARGVAFTDFLVSAFSDRRRIPTWLRGLALAALDVVPPARQLLADRMIHGAPAP